MGEKIKVRTVTWDLFAKDYPKEGVCFTSMPDTFVSDGIGDQEIGQWVAFKRTSGAAPMPVIISAQTGKGKNYFVTHNLREFALRNGQEILYVSNRVALDYQQKKELASLTHSDFGYSAGDVNSWSEMEAFSNVTVVTYHKLLRYFSQKGEGWFNSFRFVVLDECHFFYSDALFNPHTWLTLEGVVKKFQKCVRIYMSATLDDVIEPIRYFEGCMVEDKSEWKPFAYQFPKNYCPYQQHYFSEIDQIETRILESQKDEKWLVFVDKKAVGKELAERLNEKEKSTATYFDSESRRSENIVERIAWELLKAKGTFESKVLITTSVLDNGFSIRDKRICHIVICTDDKTEFLQELGRCRLEQDQVVNLYIKKLKKEDHNRRMTLYKRYQELIISYYGEDECGNFVKKGDPLKTVQSLWNRDENFCRSAIYLVDTGEGSLVPQFNGMFRWRVQRMGEQLTEYEKMFHSDSTTPIRYKAAWLGENSKYVDLDEEDHNTAVLALISYLQEAVGKELDESGDEYKEFSSKFVKLYKMAYPKDESVRRGHDRSTLRHTFVNNHLIKVKEATGYNFALQKKSGNIWVLKKDLSETEQTENVTSETD